MRIGIFTECYRPITNGVVVSVETFRRELQAQGHEVWLFTPDYEAYSDPRIIPLRSIGLPARTAYRAATPFMRRQPPPTLDVIHAHSPFSTGLLARSWARRYGAPLVFTYHTRLEDYAHYLPVPLTWGRRAMVWASRSYCNITDMVLTPTAEIQRLLQGYGVIRPIEVLPTAIALPGLEGVDRSWLRRRLGWDDRRVLLTVGRLAPEKNVSFLVDTFAHIWRAHPETALVVVGDGPDKTRLEEQARRLGLSDAIKFTGMVDRQEITRYYAGADLFVFASVTETQGLVVGEALQAGTPVVAVGVGGVLDALRGCPGSLLCAPHVEDLASRVNRLLAEPQALDALRRQTGLAGAAPGPSARRLVELYEGLLSSLRAPGVNSRSVMAGVGSSSATGVSSASGSS
ncbi:MAG TPA: glycosyltransferase [Candidatus Xenobia bacterium]|jgi:glycosyltransferase involved in cell wall biosynthesis